MPGTLVGTGDVRYTKMSWFCPGGTFCLVGEGSVKEIKK